MRYLRGVISGTTITWGSNALGVTTVVNNPPADYYLNACEDSSGKYVVLHDDNQGNPVISRSASNISASFADADSSFSVVGTPSNLTDYAQHATLFCLASQNYLIITNDSFNGTPDIQSTKWDGANWGGSYAILYQDTNASLLNWGAVKISNTDVRMLGVSAASTFSFQKFDGTSWSTLSAPTWPANGLATNSQISLSTDGTNVWAFAVGGDPNNSIIYNKYNGSAWQGWTTLVSSAATRSYVEANPSSMLSGAPVVMWTEQSGSNFNVMVNPVIGGAAGPGWYSSGGTWKYRKQITIDHTKITATTTPLGNFPVLISRTDSSLIATSSGGHVANTGATDILFTSSDGVTKLNHEIETYTAASGQLVAWVQVPSVSPTSDTVIYMYYGNQGVANQQNKTGTWDTGYAGVWHLGDGTTLTANDSTTNANNASTLNSATASAGQISGAAAVAAPQTTNAISIPDSASLGITAKITISGWYMPTTVSDLSEEGQ